MEQVFLSDKELYYSNKISSQQVLVVEAEEAKHISKVMRHALGDIIFVTDGMGKIYKTIIKEISKISIECRIQTTYTYQNQLENFTICIPRLKSQERFEFALEKCIELGFTNFAVFESLRTVAKGAKLERWNKVALSAMKQSLRSFLPKINFIKDLQKLNAENSEIIIFDQKAQTSIHEFKFNTADKYVLLFGPEGGFSGEELEIFDNVKFLKLTENRLRAETAVISACTVVALRG